MLTLFFMLQAMNPFAPSIELQSKQKPLPNHQVCWGRDAILDCLNLL